MCVCVCACRPICVCERVCVREREIESERGRERQAGGKGEGSGVVQTVGPCVPHTLAASAHHLREARLSLSPVSLTAWLRNNNTTAPALLHHFFVPPFFSLCPKPNCTNCNSARTDVIWKIRICQAHLFSAIREEAHGGKRL